MTGTSGRNKPPTKRSPPGQHAAGTPRKRALSRQPFARLTGFQKLMSSIVVAVISGVIVWLITSSISRQHYAGLPVKINRVIDEHDSDEQGDTWLFANALDLSTAELNSINRPLRWERQHGRSGEWTPFDRWAVAHGGVSSDLALTRVIVEGNRSSSVEILGIQAKAQCRQPLDGTIFSSPTAGANPVARMGFDLDSADPVAMKATGSYVSQEPYFETETISLSPGEHEVIDLVAVTSRHYCRYTFLMKVLYGEQITTETIDDNGKPFEVSALYQRNAHESPVFQYRSAYIGGVETKDGLFTHISRHRQLGGSATG